jgi:hypothetical protein
MAPKEPCAKYQYVLTSAGPKILPVADEESKDEEAPADYNSGGYLPIKVDDTFKDGRYRVLRKLGYALWSLNTLLLIAPYFMSRWGHFSTVWLVKDSQFVLSYHSGDSPIPNFTALVQLVIPLSRS